MFIQPPFKILEINVISAQDLPPVSKMLRTFAVAYIHNNDHRLTTRVDHQGKTNPTWNYKMIFRVDDKFLNSESPSVMFEIYNVAWLRDLPIGTTQLMINSFFPPLSSNNPTMRSTTLHIRRPSGHLQGLLHVSVQLIDTTPPEILCSESELSNSICTTDVSSSKDERRNNCYDEKNDNTSIISDTLYEEEITKNTHDRGMLQRLRSKRLMSNSNSGLLSPNQKMRRTSTAVSFCSGVQPIPSLVAEDMKKGLYQTGEGIDYGSCIFENWTIQGEKDDEIQSMRSKSLTWGSDDQVRVQELVEIKKKPRRRHDSERGGLFSCFGKAYGFEFKLICGSKSPKKKKDKKHERHKSLPYNNNNNNHYDDNLHRFYI
uniref:C2 domain-containing protein n=1 Tax=Solanum lycopersicum TaxID=4081 RepID=A0A3Q7G3G4_SOLLC